MQIGMLDPAEVLDRAGHVAGVVHRGHVAPALNAPLPVAELDHRPALPEPGAMEVGEPPPATHPLEFTSELQMSRSQLSSSRLQNGKGPIGTVPRLAPPPPRSSDRQGSRNGRHHQKDPSHLPTPSRRDECQQTIPSRGSTRERSAIHRSTRSSIDPRSRPVSCSTRAQPVAQGVHVDVQLGGRPLPAAARRQEPVERVDEPGVAAGVVLLERLEQRLPERRQHVLVLEREQERVRAHLVVGRPAGVAPEAGEPAGVAGLDDRRAKAGRVAPRGRPRRSAPPSRSCSAAARSARPGSSPSHCTTATISGAFTAATAVTPASASPSSTGSRPASGSSASHTIAASGRAASSRTSRGAPPPPAAARARP